MRPESRPGQPLDNWLAANASAVGPTPGSTRTRCHRQPPLLPMPGSSCVYGDTYTETQGEKQPRPKPYLSDEAEQGSFVNDPKPLQEKGGLMPKTRTWD